MCGVCNSVLPTVGVLSADVFTVLVFAMLEPIILLVFYMLLLPSSWNSVHVLVFPYCQGFLSPVAVIWVPAR